MKNNTIVYRAKTINDIQPLLKSNIHLTPVSGGTWFIKNQQDEKIHFPKYILALNNIPELSIITKTERYIDIGTTNTLEKILQLGIKNIPSILYHAIDQSIPQSIRALATIGGNIAKASSLNTCTAPLLALDAKLEIRTANEIEWIPFIKYCDSAMYEFRNTPHVITKIRINTEPWEYNFYTRLGSPYIISDTTAYFIFLIRTQKQLITEVKLIFAGDELLREREFENVILGRTLPISNKEIPYIIEKAQSFFKRENFTSEYHRQCFFNLLENSLFELMHE